MIQINPTLALYGGDPVRTTEFPKRQLFTEDEKSIVNELFDDSINNGIPIRYSGEYERRYESSFVEFMGGGYADCVNSGTSALFACIGALDLPLGSEIIVPAITDPGGIMPILFHHCIPVIADSAPGSFNCGLDQIKERITDRTKAVIVSHIGGEPADVGTISVFLKKQNIYLIEDCAQSHGAEFQDVRVGNFGDISMFSTMSSKQHSTGGQGGVVFSRNLRLIENARSIADRGKEIIDNSFTGKYIRPGLNLNLDEISAAIGFVQLKKLESFIKSTHSIGETIKNALRNNNKHFRVAEQLPDTKSVYWFVRVKIDLKAFSVPKTTLCDAIKAEGIPVGCNYEYIPYVHEWYNSKKYKDMINMVNGDLGQDLEECLYNARHSIGNHLNIYIRENFTERDTDDIVKAFQKVERHFIGHP
jgi:perosamine synthetase